MSVTGTKAQKTEIHWTNSLSLNSHFNWESMYNVIYILYLEKQYQSLIKGALNTFWLACPPILDMAI